MSGAEQAAEQAGTNHKPMNAPMAADKLCSLLDRIVRLETERREAADAVKDIFTEAKSSGYSPKALRVLVARELETAKQRTQREELESDLEVMRAALGEFATSPLGAAAMKGARHQ